ncbi:tetraspanin family protein [Opisthorchis viverrini]|uniref:Tetraspanin family protein n=1 Tax=Opisthorchis viverrini TaxID=6198 RepID=A0A1S8WKC3_OPIVI|nr:tetraspanin family protein [Opisthorchis viverrini]
MNFFLIKHILFFLNGIYMVLSLILIGLAAYARLSVYITSVSIVGGIIACGVFLFLLSLLGFIGTARHSQAALFFYIVLLFSLFLIQFSVACACLTLSTSDQRTIVEAAWQKSTNATKIDMMRTFQCCGFRRVDLPHDHPMGCPPCHFSELSCCEGDHDRQADCCTGHTNSSIPRTCPCTITCWSVVEQKLERGIRVTGTVGLFFSLVELAGVWLALQYRHKRDPSIDPNCIF